MSVVGTAVADADLGRGDVDAAESSLLVLVSRRQHITRDAGEPPP